MANLVRMLTVVSVFVLLSIPVKAQFGGGFGNGPGGGSGPNVNRPGGPNWQGPRGRRGRGRGPRGPRGPGGNGNGNGGPAGVPLPLLGGTALGHAVLLSGGYLVWRRRKTRSKLVKQIKNSTST